MNGTTLYAGKGFKKVNAYQLLSDQAYQVYRGEALDLMEHAGVYALVGCGREVYASGSLDQIEGYLMELAELYASMEGDDEN